MSGRGSKHRTRYGHFHRAARQLEGETLRQLQNQPVPFNQSAHDERVKTLRRAEAEKAEAKRIAKKNRKRH